MAVNDQELLELYQELGSAAAVRRVLLANAVDPIDVPAVRTIQRRLHAYAPDYAVQKLVTGSSKKEDTRPIAAGVVTAPDKRRGVLTGRRFVFTTAQNNTYVHQEFYESLQQFCKEREAQLIVSTITYNKSGFQNGTKEDEKLWYDPKIVPYIMDDSHVVAPGLVFCGELNVIPTAVSPLSGFENYTQDASGIIPHTKVQMQSLPRMKGEDPRFLYTTGAITQRNYIQRKAGQKAEFHHVFGALLVEIDEAGDWFARQLVANEDGVFHDLDKRYSPQGVTEHRIEAITWGDIHLEKIDPSIWEACWGDDNSLLRVLNPKYQFVHDLTDFKARNHHNIKDPFFMAEMFHRGTGNVQRDLERCGAFLAYITRFENKAVVVESNHDEALEKWLKEADIRTDPENAEFFHKANAQVHTAIREGNNRFKVFWWALNPGKSFFTPYVTFLAEDDSFVVKGIENGLHGHRGANGARGNPRGFRFIGRKVNIGHTHSAGIFDGVYVAGVSGLLDMDYNKGPSSWSHSHILTYGNGKRTIITMKNGKWKA